MDFESPDDVCTNGHHISKYPEAFRSATRIGVNFRGWVEYANSEEGHVYELVYPVGSTLHFDEMRQHTMLGQTICQHIENSEGRFDEWQFVER